MFTGCLRETKEEEVTLGEVHGDALQILVQYCYTGFIELREDTVETLLATACLLQLNAVVTACCNFLARQLHPSNCLGVAFFAEQQSCNTLLQLATAYTCQHFMQVSLLNHLNPNDLFCLRYSLPLLKIGLQESGIFPIERRSIGQITGK